MKRAVVGIAVSLTIAVLVGWAGSHGSLAVRGVPLYAICGMVAFAVHWVVFIPSYIYRTERYFDLTGTIAYVSVVACALILNPAPDLRSVLVGALVLIWSSRLGSFLFLRIRRQGKDDRFDRIKNDFMMFLMTWTLSGLWVYLTAAAGIAAMTNVKSGALDSYAIIGFCIWLLGFSVEVVADRQKTRFRSQLENQGKFISAGLWAWSRHPNYFGEIVLWIGIAVIAFPVLSGSQLVLLLSPVFVWFLLAKVTGIPLLEAKAERNWGNDPAYRSYRDSTSLLFPIPPSGAATRSDA